MTTNNNHYDLDGTFWLFFLLAVVVIGGFYWQILRRNRPSSSSKTEGFQLPSSIRLESFEDYDAQFRTVIDQTPVKEEVDILWSNTQMDASQSSVLDIQGTLAGELKRRGLQTIETSKACRPHTTTGKTDTEEESSPSSHLKQMRTFDWNRKPYQPCTAVDDQEGGYKKAQFTHILALQRTIYEQDDLIFFLRKCAYWLRPGGYLAVELVEPDEWAKRSVPPLAKKLARLQSFPSSPSASSSSSDFQRSEIDMVHTKYTSEYERPTSSSSSSQPTTLYHTEIFEDADNPGEKTFKKRTALRHIKSTKEIVEDVEYCRFQSAGKYETTGSDKRVIYLFRYLG